MFIVIVPPYVRLRYGMAASVPPSVRLSVPFWSASSEWKVVEFRGNISTRARNWLSHFRAERSKFKVTRTHWIFFRNERRIITDLKSAANMLTIWVLIVWQWEFPDAATLHMQQAHALVFESIYKSAWRLLLRLGFDDTTFIHREGRKKLEVDPSKSTAVDMEKRSQVLYSVQSNRHRILNKSVLNFVLPKADFKTTRMLLITLRAS